MRHETIHVDIDGTVTYGRTVPPVRTGEYIVAAPPRRARGRRRFIPAGVPRGVDLHITALHDCKNHLTDAPAIAAFHDYAAEVRDDQTA